MSGVRDFNYDLAVRQAMRVMEISDELRHVCSGALQPAIESAGACWSGEAAARFLAVLQGIVEDARAEAERVHALGSAMRLISDSLHEADAKAAEAVDASPYA